MDCLRFLCYIFHDSCFSHRKWCVTASLDVHNVFRKRIKHEEEMEKKEVETEKERGGEREGGRGREGEGEGEGGDCR